MAVDGEHDSAGGYWWAVIHVDWPPRAFWGRQCHADPDFCSEWFEVDASEALLQRIEEVARATCGPFGFLWDVRVGDPSALRYTVGLATYGCTGSAIFTRDVMDSRAELEWLALMDDILAEAGELGDWEYRFPVGEGRGE